jgi:uncharacterized protein YggU (UPF0235/DUF167 family)
MKKAGGLRKKLLTVRVHPGSRLTKVEKLAEDEFSVHVLSLPERGRANREVKAALADHFGLPAGCLRIVRGERSRVKSIAIESDK